MKRLSLVAVAVMGVGALGGCSSGPSYGDPMPPTGGQMAASTSLNSISTNVTGSVGGKSDGNSAFGVFDLMASLQGTATNQASSQGLGFAPAGLPDTCITGAPATGFTYNGCTYGSGATLNGTVQITPSSVAYDLSVSVGVSGVSTDTSLGGTVNVAGNTITGNLDYDIHYNVSGGLGGLGGASGDSSVTADWNITTGECGVSAGTIEIVVDGPNGKHAAKFDYTACNTFTVQNG